MKAKERKTKYYKTTGCADCKKRISADETYCPKCWLGRALNGGLTIKITN